MQKKILIVFGTRPEAIKMAPLVKAFKECNEEFDCRVCVTAQHREMLDQVLYFFEIVPEYDLDLMKPDQNLYSLTADVILSMKTVLEGFVPDYVFVHGDTTTSMASALSAFYFGAKVCHVEAGLRTYNKKSPFPEELNRQLTGRIADWHFAPTTGAMEHLLAEKVERSSIYVTGNTVIDALLYALDKLKTYEDDEVRLVKGLLNDERDTVLVTGHRRENFGGPFIEFCNALKDLSADENVQIVYPVHLNPHVRKPVSDILSGIRNVHLIEPLGYPAFVWLMNISKIIITDSGGVQEEAPALGKPVILTRNTTERPEAVEAGTVIMVGTDRSRIVAESMRLLSDSDTYKSFQYMKNPYGDGHACERIIDAVRAWPSINGLAT
jgi:UDP-N-acetylglucosamine 2-epimerase (non-hydrolysing)